jgi:hypothetical protein
MEATHRRIARLMAARLVLSIGVFAVALILVGAGREGAEGAERGLYGTIAVAFLATLVYAAVFRWVRRPLRFGSIQLATDIGIVTSLVLFSGGADSIFGFLYLPITVYGAVLFDRRGAYGTAVAASAATARVLLAAEPIELASVLGNEASRGSSHCGDAHLGAAAGRALSALSPGAADRRGGAERAPAIWCASVTSTSIPSPA